jgi:L-idonate 5-dehydrogenase
LALCRHYSARILLSTLVDMGDTMLGAVLHRARDLRVERCIMPDLKPGHVLVRVRRAGICGSDLHYFAQGHCAAFVPSRPFILGHELVGEVAAAADVKLPAVGARVVVNPARPCGQCPYCSSGRTNLCPKTIMLGSASTKPPTDGAFAHFVAVRADQCHEVPPGFDDGHGAMIEPLAVALHAVMRAGSVSGKSVLVLGAGPIGLLVAMTARVFDAVPVAVSELVATRRQTPLKLGLDKVFAADSAELVKEVRELTGDGFEVVFEASGTTQALRQAFNLVRAGGTIVQVGTLGTEDLPLPVNQIMARELQVLGSFRYGNAFAEAVQLAASGKLQLQSLISGVVPLKEINHAMTRALAKNGVLKLQVDISGA